jgi:hypothetical protein
MVSLSLTGLHCPYQPSKELGSSLSVFGSKGLMFLWLQHLGLPPLPAYDPVFNWVTERAFIYGQRTSELPASLSPSSGGLKLSVKLVSLNIQAGLVEPIYGTMCLYNKERREKLSEDFHFRFLPSEFQDEASGVQRKAVFSLDSASSAVCLLIQLEKHVTEEGGVTPSVYTRKEPVSCSQFNQLWINSYHAS